MREKVPVAEGSKAKRYYKYYDRKMASIPQDKLDIFHATPGDDSNALKIEDRAQLLKPGYLDGENGYWKFRDRTLGVANCTYMDGVTAEMLYWWFAWHPLEPLRYAIWDAENHYDIQISDYDRSKILSPDTPLPDKCRDVTHLVVESFDRGEKPSKIEIRFQNPINMGYNLETVSQNDCSFLICANTFIKTGPIKTYAVMTHMARPKDNGVEFRSRFWIGYHVIDRIPKRKLPLLVKMPVAVAKSLFYHNIHEYSNLAAILPALYHEEKDVW